MKAGIYKQTKEHKLAISQSLKGKMPKNIETIKGWNKGKKSSLQTKEKLSKIQKNLWAQGVYKEDRNEKISNTLKGEHSYLWQGGITPINDKIRHSREYRLWRTAVFERDNYTCIWCGTRGYLEVDHIKPFAYYPELRFAIDNGRTLCKPCHKTTDTYKKRRVL